MNDEVSITSLLRRWSKGDRAVEDELAEQLYPMLRAMAGAQVRRSSSALTLKPTEIANEAFLRLRDHHSDVWRDRTHFYAFAAGVLRHIIVDYLRERSAQKRGGGRMFVELDAVAEHEIPFVQDQVDWLSVDQALDELGVLDADCARVVELRVFSGMTTEEIAQVCSSSVATVGRRWRFARTWLAERLAAMEDRA